MSILSTFYKIMADPTVQTSRDFAPLLRFVTSVVRHFLCAARHSPLLFVEALFWKTRRECHAINADQMLRELGGLGGLGGRRRRVRAERGEGMPDFLSDQG